MSSLLFDFCIGDDDGDDVIFLLQRDCPVSRKPLANGLLSIFSFVMRSFCWEIKKEENWSIWNAINVSRFLICKNLTIVSLYFIFNTRYDNNIIWFNFKFKEYHDDVLYVIRRWQKRRHFSQVRIICDNLWSQFALQERQRTLLKRKEKRQRSKSSIIMIHWGVWRSFSDFLAISQLNFVSLYTHTFSSFRVVSRVRVRKREVLKSFE